LKERLYGCVLRVVRKRPSGSARGGAELPGKAIRWAGVLLIASAIAMPRPQRQAVESPNPGGRLERLGVPSSRWQVGPDLPVLYLHGTPYEMGLQQGAVLREPLRELVTEYLHNHIFSQGPAVHWGLLNYARLVSQSLPSDLQSEMLGVADGAALLYYDIVLLNVLPDLLALTSQLPSWVLDPGEHSLDDGLALA